MIQPARPRPTSPEPTSRFGWVQSTALAEATSWGYRPPDVVEGRVFIITTADEAHEHGEAERRALAAWLDQGGEDGR